MRWIQKRKLETKHSNVTDVYTSNDGSLTDDNLSDNIIGELSYIDTTEAAYNKVLKYSGSNW